MKKNSLSVLIGASLGVSLSLVPLMASAVAMDGRLYLDGMVRGATYVGSYGSINTNGYSSGSYFAMGANNPNGSVGSLQPATNGGYIELGTFQNFVTTPDVPHPQGWQGDINGDGIPDGNAGTGYTGLATPANIFAAFSFFGTSTYVGTMPVSYQNGSVNVAPTADVDLNNCTGSVCAMTVDLSSWEVYWNGSAFQQGPRPANTGPFVAATGTLDMVTMHYELDWASQIKQGPFNGVTGYWHLEGTYSAVPVPAAFWLFGSGLLGLVGVARRRVAGC